MVNLVINWAYFFIFVMFALDLESLTSLSLARAVPCLMVVANCHVVLVVHVHVIRIGYFHSLRPYISP